ncbi:MAG: hypothetical protein RIF41_29125, partial [Polyangiaceae bacterium]
MYNAALMRILGVACVVLPGCIILSGSGDDDGNAPPPEQPPVDPFTCPAWEDAAEADVEALVQGAIDELKAEGQDVNGEIWSDAARFSALIDRIYEHAGCPLPEGSAQQGLHASDAPNYFCGPGHGTAALQHPPVSDCINAACRNHDGCYAMCSEEPGFCSWSGATQPCEDTFFDHLSSCSANRFSDGLVKVIPRVLDLNPVSCSDIECPADGALGFGICSTAPESPDCADCLAYFDPDGTCLSRTECSEAQQFEHCYTANCPEMFACYGENPSSELWKTTCASPGYTGVPEDYSWALEVSSGEMPATKADGSPWDADLALGFHPPDPFVVVELVDTGDIKETVSPEDKALPKWN